MDAEREDVLKCWPGAVYMPWDEPPIGQKVMLPARLDGTRERGTIDGVFHAEPKRVHACPDCLCPRSPGPCDGWWMILLDNPIQTAPGPGMAATGIATHSLHYPPSLTPVDP